MILGTAFPGSYLFFFGLDFFTKTGFNTAARAFLAGTGVYAPTGFVYGMIAGFLVLGIIGCVAQWYMSRDRRYSPAKTRY